MVGIALSIVALGFMAMIYSLIIWFQKPSERKGGKIEWILGM
ncbi:hypothetical protein [Mammaliicoccus sciuri]|nr:hypothetical protein [Mammaliicoccus sciuri]